MRATACSAASEGSPEGIHASPLRAIRPVSTRPAAKSSSASALVRKAALVFTGQHSTLATISSSLVRAASRVGAWAISLAIIGS
jgi:hypothetical protein